MVTKRKKKIDRYKTAVSTSKANAHNAIKKAEDALFESQDRQVRRAQDQAADRARRGLGVR